jgi:holo-[acyl-carrier protein] synthase
MIAGLGTDIVSIARIRAALARHPQRFAARVLSAAELERFNAMPDGAAYLAKRFAAKEAFFKALGEPSSRANTWHQLTVANDARGRPQLVMGSLLANLIKKRGICATHVSLSDEHEAAVATVILEKET